MIPRRRIVGVRLQQGDPVCYFDAGSLSLKVGDWVTVEIEGGVRRGWTVIEPSQVIHADVRSPLSPVLGLVEPEGSRG
ncbi:MAG: hypothetical protein HYU29_04340 [Chloroflexi bacterium]|nr:hypothetical protein [Chloroflexota bacterium]